MITALHKLGAVIIPASFLLVKHDIEYRINAASVKAVVCTADGDVPKNFEEALPQCDTVTAKWMVNGCREGWLDFDKELEEASEEWERVPTLATEPMLIYFFLGNLRIS